MDNTGNNLPRRTAPEKKPAPVNTSVKTIYLEAGGNADFKNSVLGTLFLFFCVFAVCIGLILCVVQSFSLEIDFFAVITALTISLVFFTLIYFLPSGFLTFAAFLIAAGAAAGIAAYNFKYIKDAVYYVLNLCLFKINQEGYIIGSIVDYDLAKTANEANAGYINTTAVLAAVLLAAVFSFLVYSKRNIIYSFIISVGIVFPGFFYGLIPSYFAFSLVAAFWVSQFTINMFESGYMEYMAGRENTVPENKLAKQKFKTFKKDYKKNKKSLRSEIVNIVRSPNKNENLMKLDRLVRNLESISKNNRLFFMFYGLNELKKPKRAKQKAVKNPEKAKKPKKFLNPVQLEQHRQKNEAAEKKEALKAAVLAEKKEFAAMPPSQRIKIKFKNNLSAKRKYLQKSGHAGLFSFIVAFTAISAVQPFITPDARMDFSMPETVMDFLTSTVEYTLVGSDSSVYGGYTGGMGGGSLYRPEGARFKNKPILKITSAQNSSVMYLKGWTGTIYTGRMWREADKKQLEAYNALGSASPIPKFQFVPERKYFSVFTENMQNISEAPFQKRRSELKIDNVNIEHLVSGGKRSFLPYFTENFQSGSFSFKTTADLSVEVTNSLFRYPSYTADFYTVDNVLNRTMPYAVEDLKKYLDYYYYQTDVSENTREIFSRMDPFELSSLMPDIKFFSERDFYSIANRTFDKLNEEGTFYEYSAPSQEYANTPEYHGYLYIPYKYDQILDIVKVRYNLLAEGGNGNSIDADFVGSEILYSAFAREYYLDIPESMPQEIADLAKEITEGAKSDYEKALAVEKYIAENYNYTLNPVMPLDPRGDYVFNFLFDIKEGYCTAYASSMVMMLRTLGIPARYAEGYLVDMSKKQRDEEGREFLIVYDYDGHAWPEVYLRGIGWIPFEPTVSYAEDETPEAPPYIYNPPPRLPEPGGAYIVPEPADDEDDEETAAAASGLPWLFYTGLTLILACAAVYAVNRFIISKRFKNFKSATTNAAVLHMLTYILIFLRRCGFVIHNNEGLRAFSKRVSSNFETINPSGWDEAALIMQKARYSRHEISDEERKSVLEFTENLRKECLKNLKSNLKFKLRFVYFLI